MKKKTVSTIVFLISFYIICQAAADIGATKMVQIGSIVLPAGAIVFALTFTLRDMIHKRLGKDWAKAAIFSAAALNVFQSGYLFVMTKIKSPVWFALGEPWNQIFEIVPSITIGSIIAELISELIDTEAYQWWWDKFPKAPQWTRVLFSNCCSLPIDSLVFATLAFVLLPPVFGTQSTPFLEAMQAATGQVVYKAIVTLVSLPLIYLTGDKPIIEKQ